MMQPAEQSSVGLVSTEDVKHVESFAGVVNLKADPPLADTQAVLRRIDPGESPYVAGTFDG
jgi:hypothetical protein